MSRKVDEARPGADGARSAPAAEIRNALVAGIARRRRRARTRAALGGAVALLAAAAIGAATELSDGPSSALALTIEARGSWIQVEITDADASAAQMTRELRLAGIDATVRVIPTNDRHVGQWLGFQRVGEEPSRRSDPSRAEIWDAGRIGARGRTLLLRDGALARLEPARIIFYIGRAPHDGEARYALFADGPHPVN